MTQRSGAWLINTVVPLVTMVAFLALWEWAVDSGHLSAFQFPPPSKIAASAYELTVDGFPAGTRLATHVGITLLRIFAGYTLALILAIPLGLLIGSWRPLDLAMAPVVAFCRSVATLSLLPVAVVWFGTGEGARVFLIGYGCFWVMLSNSIDAVKLVDPVLIRAARTMDTPRHKVFLNVALPATLPRIAAGARVALGVGFMVIVGAEMIGTELGLGALIMEARTFYRSDITVVGMFVIGIFGLALSIGLSRLERWLLPWQARQEQRLS